MSRLLAAARDTRSRDIAESDAYKASAHVALVDIAVRDLRDETLPDDSRDLVSLLTDLELTEDYFIELQKAITSVAKYQSRIADCQERMKHREKYRTAFIELKKRHKAEFDQARRDDWHFNISPPSELANVGTEIRRLSLTYPHLFEPNPRDQRQAVPVAAIAEFKPLPPPAPQPNPEVNHANDSESPAEVEQPIHTDPPAGSRHRPKAKHSPSDLPGVGVRQQ